MRVCKGYPLLLWNVDAFVLCPTFIFSLNTSPGRALGWAMKICKKLEWTPLALLCFRGEVRPSMLQGSVRTLARPRTPNSELQTGVKGNPRYFLLWQKCHYPCVCAKDIRVLFLLSQMEQISLFGKGDLSITESVMNSVCVCCSLSASFCFRDGEGRTKVVWGYEQKHRTADAWVWLYVCVCVCVLGVASNVRIFFWLTQGRLLWCHETRFVYPIR